MIPPPPQREYTITESEVCQIEDDYPFTARNIRSRPRPPAPEQDNPAWLSRVITVISKEEEERISRAATLAENKRVLDALEEYRKKKEIKAPEKGDYLYPGRAEKRDMLHTFWVWIESLRITGDTRNVM
jgi:hypothetical protein